MDIVFLGFDHGVVHALAVPGSVMGLVGSLFMTFWDKVFVSSSRAHQDMKNVIGEWTAGMFVRSGQFQRAKFVAVRQGEAYIWAGGQCSRGPGLSFVYKTVFTFTMSKRSLLIDFCSPLKFSRWLP